MYFELYFDPNCKIFEVPENEGFASVPSLVEELQRRGIQIEVKDTGSMTEEKHQEAYRKAIIPATRKKYRIRQIFGSRGRGGGPDFGKGVPALLVYRDREAPYPDDVYPHEERGKTVTIKEFLEQFLRGLEARV